MGRRNNKIWVFRKLSIPRYGIFSTSDSVREYASNYSHIHQALAKNLGVPHLLRTMVRFEVVGLFDCPWYAKACKIAEEIMNKNPSLEFVNEMLDPMQWTEFITNMKTHQGWDIKNSPCVYELLTDRESKARLIGDVNDFCEFALLYFDVTIDFNTTALKNLVTANKTAFAFGKGTNDNRRGHATIFYIAIVNAPLPTLELMLTQLLSPCSMIPNGILLNISIYDEYTPKENLNGLLMEIIDMASPLLEKARVVNTLPMAFYKCNLLLLMEDFSRALTEQPKDWLDRVDFKVVGLMSSFNSQTSLNNCRILIGGEGPSCYIAEICRKMTPNNISGPGKIIASGQAVIQCAKAELGKIGGLPAGKITRLHAYGWPGITGCYVEVGDATVRNHSIRGHATEIGLAEIATGADYIMSKFSSDFLTLQKERLAFLVKQPNRYMCMAEAAISIIHTWLVCDQLVKLMGIGRTRDSLSDQDKDSARRMTGDSDDSRISSERSKSSTYDDDEQNDKISEEASPDEDDARRSMQSGSSARGSEDIGSANEDAVPRRSSVRFSDTVSLSANVPRRMTGESAEDNMEEANEASDPRRVTGESAKLPDNMEGTNEGDAPPRTSGESAGGNSKQSTSEENDDEDDVSASVSEGNTAEEEGWDGAEKDAEVSGDSPMVPQNTAESAMDKTNSRPSASEREEDGDDNDDDVKDEDDDDVKDDDDDDVKDEDDEEVSKDGTRGEVDISALFPGSSGDVSKKDSARRMTAESGDAESEGSTSYGYGSSYSQGGPRPVSDGATTPETYLPVVHVGIECSRSSGFPDGTFMIQPAVCVNGKWQPLGKVNDDTFGKITTEVKRLWALRQMLICRDINLSETFPDYAEMTKEPVVEEPPENNLEQWDGEGDGEEDEGAWYTTEEEEEEQEEVEVEEESYEVATSEGDL